MLGTTPCSSPRQRWSHSITAQLLDARQLAGFACQAMIADSRHPTRPGEIRTGRGNRPSFMARQMVECEREVTSMTSLSRMKRSSLLTVVTLFDRHVEGPAINVHSRCVSLRDAAALMLCLHGVALSGGGVGEVRTPRHCSFTGARRRQYPMVRLKPFAPGELPNAPS